jgi:uncharacterized protein DUF4142
MLSTIALLMMFADAPPAQTTLPRHPDPDPVEQQATRQGEPTDPLFDRNYVATDDPAFILAAVENTRQGLLDARSAEGSLSDPKLRAAAQKIGAQNEATGRKLEKLASTKGWRLPQGNPGRQSTVPTASATRSNASFILNQISFHENTVAQYRAQLAGKGDADLKRAIKDALPGYEKNLDLLLTLKP